MPGLYEKLILVAAVSSLAVWAAARASPVVRPEPIRCLPCTQDKLDSCPAIPADCQQVLREPGCGCCMACALERGASCGVHTAHCGEGLRCTPRPGEARPLHALTRGQGVCTEDLGQGSLRVSWFSLFTVNICYIYHLEMSKCDLKVGKVLIKKQYSQAIILFKTWTEEADGVTGHGSLQYLLGLNVPVDPQDTVEGQESIKAKLNAIRNKLAHEVRRKHQSNQDDSK